MSADTRKTSDCRKDAAPRSLLRQAEEHTRSLLLQASRQFGLAPPRLAVRFDLNGKTAGMVKFQRGQANYVVRYNPRLLAQYEDASKTQERIEAYRREGRPVPRVWVTNPFHRFVYERNGWLAEKRELKIED